MNELTKKIMVCAVERDLHKADPNKQMLKVVEEIGELAESLAKNDHNNTLDSIGDSYITLVVISMQLGVDIETCVSIAYDEIKNRQGEMVNGVFIKD